MLRDIGVPISSTGVAMILVGGGHPAMHQCCTRVKVSLAAAGLGELWAPSSEQSHVRSPRANYK